MMLSCPCVNTNHLKIILSKFTGSEYQFFSVFLQPCVDIFAYYSQRYNVKQLLKLSSNYHFGEVKCIPLKIPTLQYLECEQYIFTDDNRFL